MTSCREQDRAARAPVIDEAYLARLSEQVGDDVIAELLSDGLVEISDRLDQLAETARDRRAEAALIIAHDLTSIAGHLGLARLSHIAAACQRTLRMPEPGDLLTTVEPVLSSGTEACDALRGRGVAPRGQSLSS